MSVTSTPIFPQTIKSSEVQILPADTSSLKTLYTAGANGSRIEAIYATNTDTAAAYAIQLTVVESATNYLLGTINLPLSSGNTTAAPTVNLFNAGTQLVLNKDSDGNPYIYLESGAVLKVNSTTTVNSGKILSFVANGGDY